jgi:hypothetical protein
MTLLSVFRHTLFLENGTNNDLKTELDYDLFAGMLALIAYSTSWAYVLPPSKKVVSHMYSY